MSDAHEPGRHPATAVAEREGRRIALALVLTTGVLACVLVGVAWNLRGRRRGAAAETGTDDVAFPSAQTVRMCAREYEAAAEMLKAGMLAMAVARRIDAGSADAGAAVAAALRSLSQKGDTWNDVRRADGSTWTWRGWELTVDAGTPAEDPIQWLVVATRQSATRAEVVAVRASDPGACVAVTVDEPVPAAALVEPVRKWRDTTSPPADDRWTWRWVEDESMRRWSSADAMWETAAPEPGK